METSSLMLRGPTLAASITMTDQAHQTQTTTIKHSLWQRIHHFQLFNRQWRLRNGGTKNLKKSLQNRGKRAIWRQQGALKTLAPSCNMENTVACRMQPPQSIFEWLVGHSLALSYQLTQSYRLCRPSRCILISGLLKSCYSMVLPSERPRPSSLAILTIRCRRSV